MEVFMSNLPLDLTDTGLKNHLKPLVKKIQITDWDCQKPRKKNYGSATFLRTIDGQEFLRHYGQRPCFIGAKARFEPRLNILGSAVYCKLSKNPPDLFLLRSLKKSAEDRREAEQLPHSPEEPKIVFETTSISCGIYQYSRNRLGYAPDIEWHSALGTAKFAKKSLLVDFDDGTGQKRIEIPYRTVEAIFVTSRPTALTLTLWETPQFFGIQEPELAELMSKLMLNRAPLRKRDRLTELPHPKLSHRRVLGQALVYRINVSPANFFDLSKKLVQRGILTVSRHDLAVLSYGGKANLSDGIDILEKTMQQVSKHIPFEVLFQLEAMAKNGYLPPWTVQSLLVKTYRNSKDPIKENTISAEAFRKLLSQIPFPGVEIDESTFDVEEIWSYIEQNQRDIQEGLHKELITERGRENLTMVHKVNITPTGMTLHGPDPEAKNRILRRFSAYREYFIRVQFCDEDGTDLRFNSQVSYEAVYARFKRVMEDGIAICGRVYSFLGYSHSSLRSHSAWFMAPFVHNGRLETYFTVIPDLGKFGGIRSPARCAARIGQAFSETPFAIELDYNGIKYGKIPDVMSTDKRHIFSDGVGTLSSTVVEAIRDSMPQKRGSATCFQIRWGGAKGMLALDARLQGSIMNVRDSMVKFESDDIKNLEICDTANKPIPMVLNRQMIKILEDMGIPQTWFLEQQSAALLDLQLVSAHISGTVAFLKRQNIADRVGFPQLIRWIESIGINYRKDRFMRSVVEAALLREIRLLKQKARIPISHGVTLFGIMDETNYLEAGEIFITFDKTPTMACHALDLNNRRMLVTRSPALHPGDIQIATNTIPPEHHILRQLRNCIVFSQKGARDLPSCLSGGDLDGDTYNIIWDAAAIAGCQCSFPPAEYARAAQLDIGRPVDKQDMTEFFIKFMATDQLGLIATRHMILADQRPHGTADPDCIALAELHSTGVDYSKTGIPVDMEKFRKIKTNKHRPHFLAPVQPTYIKNRTEIEFDLPTRPRQDEEEDEGDNSGPKYQYYRSDRINGVLFDAIDEKKIWYETIKDRPEPDEHMWNKLLEYIMYECDTKFGGISWERMEQEALSIRRVYEDSIYNVMIDYSGLPTQALTELEVFTGSIFSASGVQSRRQRDRSLQLKDEFDRIARWTENLIRRRTSANGKSNEDDYEPYESSNGTLALSIACLQVSHLKEVQGIGKMGRSKDDLQSFRVISACCVMRELNAATKRAGAEEWY